MTTKPRRLQEIFNAIIEAGHYPHKESTAMENWKPTSNFMCESLRHALNNGVISPDESHKAKRAIRTYINRLIRIKNCYSVGQELPSLWSALYCAKLVKNEPYYSEISQPILLAIYKNWAKRPLPKKKNK